MGVGDSYAVPVHTDGALKEVPLHVLCVYKCTCVCVCV